MNKLISHIKKLSRAFLAFLDKVFSVQTFIGYVLPAVIGLSFLLVLSHVYLGEMDRAGHVMSATVWMLSTYLYGRLYLNEELVSEDLREELDKAKDQLSKQDEIIRELLYLSKQLSGMDPNKTVEENKKGAKK